MADWQMTCTCGDTMQMDGETGEEAVDKLMTTAMTPDAVGFHMAEKHPGEPIPTPEQTRGALIASAVLA